MTGRAFSSADSCVALAVAVWSVLMASLACIPSVAAGEPKPAAVSPPILGLTGKVDAIEIAVPAATKISLVTSDEPTADVSLKRMAEWALNYLSETPRKSLGYEPVFQCHPLLCPPV